MTLAIARSPEAIIDEKVFGWGKVIIDELKDVAQPPLQGMVVMLRQQ